MTLKFMTNSVTGQVAFFEEIGTSGQWDDPAAPRNAPLADPASHLANVKFHSDLDMFEVLISGSLAVNHALVSGTGALTGFATSYNTNAGADDTLLYDFSSLDLDYVPRAIVVVNDQVMFSTMPVQIGSNGAARYSTAYISETELRVASVATVGTSDLPAKTITYSFLIFKEPPAKTGNTLLHYDESTGITELGLGKFSSDRRYLQVQDTSPFAIITAGESIDVANGAPKYFNPDGTTLTPIPSTMATALSFFRADNTDPGGRGETFGASMAYNGSATAPTTIKVGAP